LNEDALAALLERLYGAGCHGVYVGGNTGEGLLLPLELREALTAAVVRHTPAGKQVVVHVGTAETAGSLRLARQAAEAGAHAVSALPPAGGYRFGELRAYYETLAAATPLPFLVYFFPEAAPGVRTYEQIAELCTLPGVVGAKFTDFDFYTLSRLKQRGHVVFNGRDEAFACGLLMGADGGIGSFYNIAPALFVEAYAAAGAGDWARARAVQERVNRLISIVLGYPMMAALKKIVAWQGIEYGAVVGPRLALTKEQEAGLAAELRSAGFL
jgi:N-acetylneuraminate lyase